MQLMWARSGDMILMVLICVRIERAHCYLWGDCGNNDRSRVCENNRLNYVWICFLFGMQVPPVDSMSFYNTLRYL
jgi:hypothetical protein